jgi:lysophospholipase L1-like esterase
MKKTIKSVLIIIILLSSAGSALAADSIVIVVEGSSTAAGTGASDSTKSWVGLYRAYAQGINPKNKIINLARPGYVTANISFSQAFAYKPDGIILSMPSNDAAHNVPVSESIANYDAFVAKAKAQNIPVWITTTQPRNLSDTGLKLLVEMRDSTYSRYKKMAVNFWDGLANPDGTIKSIYSRDGIHPNDAGHDTLYNHLLAKKVLDSLIRRQHPTTSAFLPHGAVKLVSNSTKSIRTEYYSVTGKRIAIVNGNISYPKRKLVIVRKIDALGINRDEKRITVK